MTYYRWRIYDQNGHLRSRAEPKNLDTANAARNKAKKAANDYNVHADRQALAVRVEIDTNGSNTLTPGEPWRFMCVGRYQVAPINRWQWEYPE